MIQSSTSADESAAKASDLKPIHSDPGVFNESVDVESQKVDDDTPDVGQSGLIFVKEARGHVAQLPPKDRNGRNHRNDSSALASCFGRGAV